MSNRAILLDRDGVINRNRPDNVKTWEEFEFEAGSLSALARLRATTFRLIVISNQSGIGRGHMTTETVEAIHARMSDEIALAGGRLDRIYYCPHKPDDGCLCRKPSPGMLLRGRDEFGLDLGKSYLVGDWVDDITAARKAGVTPVLVRTGRGAQAMAEMERQGIPLPVVVENLASAIEWILDRDQKT